MSWKTKDDEIIKYLNRCTVLGLNIQELEMSELGVKIQGIGKMYVYLVKVRSDKTILYIPKEVTFLYNLTATLKKVKGELEVIGGESLENLDSAFIQLKLDILNLSKLNISNVTYMKNTFAYCEVKQIIFNEDWDTSRVISMNRAFADMYNCNELELDLNSWNMENVMDISGMFIGSTIKSLKINKWKLRNGVNKDYIFYRFKTEHLDYKRV